MPYIFLVPSEQGPWKLLLQPQLFLLLALRSSAVSGSGCCCPDQSNGRGRSDWIMAPSRWNLPCSKGWKINVSNLLTLPFVPVLQPHCGSAPCARAGTTAPSQESFAGVLPSAHTGNASLSTWNVCWICLCCCCLIPLHAGTGTEARGCAEGLA